MSASSVKFLAAVAVVAIGGATVGEVLDLTSVIQLAAAAIVLASAALTSLLGGWAICKLNMAARRKSRIHTN